MNSIAVSAIVFASIFGSGLVGMVIRRAFPEDYLGSSEKEVARLVTGLITTMSAIVLGMLVSSAKSSYDARTNEVAEISSEVVTVDRMLARYGTETGGIPRPVSSPCADWRGPHLATSGARAGRPQTAR